MGFSLFGTFIPYYGLCIVIGLDCAFLLGCFLCNQSNINIDDFIIIGVYLIGFGFLGAKILYIFVSLRNIDFSVVFQNMKTFNTFIGSGFVFYGGLVGGLLGLIFVQKVHKIQIRVYIRTIAPCLSLAHAFGRIGCSLAGCCYGKETSCKVFFKYSKSIVAPNEVHLFPVQGIESFLLFLLTIVLILLYMKNQNCKVHFIYIVCYSIIRFILEFLRGDTERGFFMFFSTSQIISIILLMGIFIFLFITKTRINNIGFD